MERSSNKWEKPLSSQSPFLVKNFDPSLPHTQLHIQLHPEFNLLMARCILLQLVGKIRRNELQLALRYKQMSRSAAEKNDSNLSK